MLMENYLNEMDDILLKEYRKFQSGRNEIKVKSIKHILKANGLDIVLLNGTRYAVGDCIKFDDTVYKIIKKTPKNYDIVEYDVVKR